MDLEKEKKEFMDYLLDLEKETRILLERIEKAKTELPNIKTKEDGEKFNSENELEKGLEHITLF